MLCSLCLKATKHHSENRIAKCVRLFCMLAVLLFSSCSVMSDSLWHHGLQHTRLPCPSPSLRLCLNSCPLSWWCHSAISSFVVAFPSCLLSFPASGHFQMSQLFASCDQNISFNISPSSEYSGLISFRTNWFDLLAVKGTLKSLPTPDFEGINSLVLSHFYCPARRSIHDYWRNHSFDYIDFCWQSEVCGF